MIYFWNDKQLARDFQNNLVSEKHKFIYFLIFYLSMLVPGMLAQLDAHSATAPQTAMPYGPGIGFCSLIVQVASFFYLYKINQRGDGKAFIERVISLMFPLTIRMIAITVPLMILLIAIAVLIKHGSMFPEASIMFGISFGLIIYGYYITRMRRLFLIASGQEND